MNFEMPEIEVLAFAAEDICSTSASTTPTIPFPQNPKD